MTVTAPMEVKPGATDVTRDTERGRDTHGLQLTEPESYWCSETVTQDSRQGSEWAVSGHFFAGNSDYYFNGLFAEYKKINYIPKLICLSHL